MQREGMTLALVEACKYGNEDCLSNAKTKLEAFDPETFENELDRDQKTAGYCYGIQESNEQWQKLWDYYLKE